MAVKSGALAIIMLAMLLAPAMPAMSDGGGDYPPPASGDWVITQDTWVENETITLNGNITMIGANLTLRNVAVFGNTDHLAIDADASSSFNARDCVFTNGPDGQLTFILTGPVDIADSSFLRGPGSVWGIGICLYTPEASVTGCVVEGTIECQSDTGPVLDGTLVQNSYVGARFMNATTYSGVTFHNCSQGAFGGPGAIIDGCTFDNCTRGVLLSDRTRIERSDFQNCTTGLEGWYNYETRKDNAVSGCSFTDCSLGFHAGWNTTLQDSVFRGCREGLVVLGNASVGNCAFLGCAAAIEGPGASDIELGDSTFEDSPRAVNASVSKGGTVRHCSFKGPDAGPVEALLNLSGVWDIRDSVLSGGNGASVSIWAGNSKMINTTFPFDKATVIFGASLDVAWYLDTTIVYPNGTPAEGARLRTEDRSGNVLSNLVAGPDGRTPRQEIGEYIREWNRTTYFTPHSLSASKDGLARNLSVNLNQNLDLTLTLADVTAPWVRFVSPANGTLMNTTRRTFSGTAGDDQGVASVRLRAGTGEWVAAEGTSVWNTTLDLLEGESEIIAEAADGEGNRAIATVQVSVDSIAPVIEITYPAPDILVNATSIELTGRTEPGCTVLVDGEAAPFYLGQFSTTVALQEGRNTVLVLARDAAGNVGFASVNVTRDTIPPALELTAPQNGEVAGRAVLAVSGTAEPGARVLVNGAAAVLSGPFFTTDILLVEGENTIHVQAMDAAGNQAALSVRVILDRTAPLITVELQNGTIVQSAVLRLAGHTEPGAALSVNGVPVTVAPDGNFSTDVSLMLGPNRIHLEATDLAGNAAWLDRTITREEAPRPTTPAVPEPARGPDTAVVVAIAVAVMAIILVLLYFILGRRPGAPTDREDGDSGPRPEGRQP